MRVLIFDNMADIINVVESNKIKLCKQLNDIVFRVFTEEKVYENGNSIYVNYGFED